MEVVVLRREQKYLMNIIQSQMLFHKLECVLPGDPVSGTKPYMVRSLYFDTVHQKDYEEKIGGFEERKKIRLRVYNSESQSAKLEVKEKQGYDQVKRSLTVTKEDALALIRGEYEVLDHYKSSLATYIKNRMVTYHYRPACVVEYQRRAFMIPTNDIRITFDSEIASSECNFNIFDPQLQTYPVTPPDSVCLEVKYNRFLLQYVKDLLHLEGAEETSNSKYCLARKYGQY